MVIINEVKLTYAIQRSAKKIFNQFYNAEMSLLTDDEKIRQFEIVIENEIKAASNSTFNRNEADEIDIEDLQAAGDMYDRMFNETK